MFKYVAFIDILGFKKKLNRLSQQDAERFIADFSSMLYREWRNCNYQNQENINGFIVSDSIIVHTINTDSSSLKLLLDFIVNIYKKAFVEKGILLRGAIAKGCYEQLSTYSFSNLQKGLIVGQAYINAYTLESSYKGSLIMFKEDVKEDILELTDYASSLCEVGYLNNDAIYSLKWADISYLLIDENLNKFIRLAIEANWLPHYYQTLYLFLTGVRDKRKEAQVFQKILINLGCYEESNWREIDLFIKNAFSNDVNANFQKMFLAFLRENLIKNEETR